MKRFTPALALAAALTLGCSDTRPLTGPESVPPPRFAFSDGARGGNPDFFFLFPLGNFPRFSSNWDVGKAKTDKNARVEICRLTTGATPQCQTVIKQFTPDQITVVMPTTFSDDEGNEYQFPREPFYRVIWNTSQPALNPDRFYRIRVLIGDHELGFADIDPVRTLAQLLKVDRTKYVGVLMGLPFPIRFRIEQGSLCDANTTCVEKHVTKEQGGLVIDDDETVYIDIPPNALPVDATITIERKAVPENGTCESTSTVVLQWEGCFVITSFPDLRPFGGFQEDVVVAFCIEPGVPERLRANLEMIKWDDGVTKRLEDAPAPFLGDCENFQGTSPTPNPGVIGWAERGLRFFASRVGKLTGVRARWHGRRSQQLLLGIAGNCLGGERCGTNRRGWNAGDSAGGSGGDVARA